MQYWKEEEEEEEEEEERGGGGGGGHGTIIPTSGTHRRTLPRRRINAGALFPSILPPFVVLLRAAHGLRNSSLLPRHAVQDVAPPRATNVVVVVAPLSRPGAFLLVGVIVIGEDLAVNRRNRIALPRGAFLRAALPRRLAQA